MHSTQQFVDFKKAEIEQSIPDRFEQQVAKYSDRIAVKSKTCKFTYEQLNRAANRAARAILRVGGRREERVAIFLEHDTDLIVAMLAIFKAGKISVPLEVSYPAARINYVLEDTLAQAIITNTKNLPLLAKSTKRDCQLINIDQIDIDDGDDNLGLSIPPDALAWILYTSGSTGTPKGVVQNHRNTLNEIRRSTNAFLISSEDRLSFTLPCTVAGGVREILLPLLNGASLYPLNIKEEGLTNFANTLRQEKITVSRFVSTVFRSFLSHLNEDEKLLSHRLIYVGGEPLTRRDVELFRARVSSDCILVNAYGATETGICRYYFITKETLICGEIAPIGYAVDDMEVFPADECGEKVSAGEAGEIVVKSRYLSPGYWRRPDLTHASFLPDLERGDERIYRTGDLGLIRPDGCLEYLGRKDYQVKISGRRIEASEIETALLDVAGIREVVVVARETRRGYQSLVAYVVPAQGQSHTSIELRSLLKAKLPDYMVPSTFAFLNALPRTPNGKVDRRALPPPDQTEPQIEKGFIAPRNILELNLAKMWEGILGISPISIEDNFFDLGGNSLQAIQLCGQISKQLGRSLLPAALFRAPTIKQVVKLLRQETNSRPLSSLVAVEPHGSKPPFFCVHGYNSYVHLAHYLGTNQPFYGLAQHLSGKQIHYTCVQDIAAHYLEEVRSLQPKGPYYLAGHSIGAAIAYEMAQQLTKQGEAVSLLALIDPVSLNLSSGSADLSTSFVTRFSGHLTQLEALSLDTKLNYILEKTRKRFVDGIKRTACRVYHLVGLSLPPALQSFYVDKIVYGTIYPKARDAYVPQSYPGNAVIFHAEESSYDPELDWKKLITGGVEIQNVSGDHLSILAEPHVRLWAEALSTCLQREATGLSDAKPLDAQT